MVGPQRSMPASYRSSAITRMRSGSYGRRATASRPDRSSCQGYSHQWSDRIGNSSQCIKSDGRRRVAPALIGLRLRSSLVRFGRWRVQIPIFGDYAYIREERVQTSSTQKYRSYCSPGSDDAKVYVRNFMAMLPARGLISGSFPPMDGGQRTGSCQVMWAVGPGERMGSHEPVCFARVLG
jgi:hypothetical protein